ncbi:hypothetical protein L6475_08740 [Prevotella sp. E9-3]|uniref:hypothetical protein n=1 Tax=Prevotella sp. E9-3 TaxID=2913621 RepID=UPI001EDB9310|nr:hypothetical protein [Prevotella sp. E9-3]UKK47310.1 hypothetical protein L6475_08740 [Prevotella sp. E9-3]
MIVGIGIILMSRVTIMCHFKAHRLAIQENARSVIAQPMTVLLMEYVNVTITRPIISGIIKIIGEL